MQPFIVDETNIVLSQLGSVVRFKTAHSPSNNDKKLTNLSEDGITADDSTKLETNVLTHSYYIYSIQLKCH